MTKLSPAHRRLIAAACRARQRAYAPYSQFPVGAALLGANGRIYTGANIENASYGLTICAERAALAAALAAGQRRFVAIACVAPSAGVTPCGACRQVLAEFGNLTVLCADSRRPSHVQIYQLSDLLPHPFRR